MKTNIHFMYHFLFHNFLETTCKIGSPNIYIEKIKHSKIYINIRKTQCNPKTQAQFKNVASRPLVDCLVEDENEPLINWLTVPFLHIVSSVSNTEYVSLIYE